MARRSCSASGDQSTAGSPLRISAAGAADNALYVQRPALASVELPDAVRDIGTEAPKLFDMRQQLAPDQFLIGFREGRDLCDGFLQNLCHEEYYIISTIFEPGRHYYIEMPDPGIVLYAKLTMLGHPQLL